MSFLLYLYYRIQLLATLGRHLHQNGAPSLKA